MAFCSCSKGGRGEDNLVGEKGNPQGRSPYHPFSSFSSAAYWEVGGGGGSYSKRGKVTMLV